MLARFWGEVIFVAALGAPALAAGQELPANIGGGPRLISPDAALSRSAPAGAVDHALRLSEISLSLDNLTEGRGAGFPPSFPMRGGDLDADPWRFHKAGGSAVITLFPGETLWLEGARVEDAGQSSSWIADVVYPESGVAVITRTANGAYGTFDVGNRRYAFTSTDGAQALVKEIDPKEKGVCLTGMRPKGYLPHASNSHLSKKGNGVGGKAGGSTNLDILFLYTPSVISYYGDPDAVIGNMIASLNAAFSHSGVNGSARAVYYGVQSGLFEPKSTSDFLFIRDQMIVGRAPFQGLASLRDKHGAGIVVLLVRGNYHPDVPSVCGVAGGLDNMPLYDADFSSIFSDEKAHIVVAANCANDDRTFHHEVGHDLGGWHDSEFKDWTLVGGPAYACGIGNGSCGYTDSSNGFRTIMGSWFKDGLACNVNGCPRLLRFSDFDQRVWANAAWRPLGRPPRAESPGHENFVATLNGEGGRTATIPWVAAYRTPQGPAPGQPLDIQVESCMNNSYIHWPPAPGVVGWYEGMVRGVSSSSPWVEIFRGNRNAFVRAGASNFYFRVRACNSYGCSPWLRTMQVRPSALACP